ncbi:G2/mitotic-specific cyclin S13-7-like isoform X1 [Mangifera indica]|uniref:G2/mitotic-specific cyclin S13-7-like isoform X1 n=1 Tax=Mangifera indica TaxID=29780 RepID=UPI001CFB2500|nr:G2/mitotic-specific cyclin S13-7-like isoform X1 [Mangifera indica]
MEAEAKVVIPRKPRGGKVRNDPAKGKNRQVLRDIGNLEVLQNIEGKISRPITRGFRAQLLANAKVAAEQNKLVVVDDGVTARRKDQSLKKAAGTEKKLSEEPKCDDLIVISSDEKEKGKAEDKQKKLPDNWTSIGPSEEGIAEPCGRQRSREKTLRNRVKAFSSILTARSKAAGGIANKPKDVIVDIDAADADDGLAVVEYVEDIYMFYKEDESRVHDYMISQPINERMRTVLVVWLIEVHDRFELTPETLYLTINIFDRYLSRKTVSRDKLQLVGISSMLIACKYEEIWAPLVNDFVCISDYVYDGEEVCAMEKEILGELGWYLTVPTPYVFLVRYLKASVLPDQEMENMVFFLAELGITSYHIIISYCPSMFAASAVYTARCTLNKRPYWTETLKHHTGYCEKKIKDCAKLLAKLHVEAKEHGLTAVCNKFLCPEKGFIAHFAPAEDLLSSSS